MQRAILEREHHKVMNMISNGDITVEQAELILVSLILEKMNEGAIDPTQASVLLRKIR